MWSACWNSFGLHDQKKKSLHPLVEKTEVSVPPTSVEECTHILRETMNMLDRGQESPNMKTLSCSLCHITRIHVTMNKLENQISHSQF